MTAQKTLDKFHPGRNKIVTFPERRERPGPAGGAKCSRPGPSLSGELWPPHSGPRVHTPRHVCCSENRREGLLLPGGAPPNLCWIASKWRIYSVKERSGS